MVLPSGILGRKGFFSIVGTIIACSEEIICRTGMGLMFMLGTVCGSVGS